MSLTVALGDASRFAAALSSRGASSPSSSPTSWGGTVKSARGARVPWPRVADARGRNIGIRRSVFSPRAGPREFHSSFFLFYADLHPRRGGLVCRRVPVEPSVVGHPGRLTPPTGHQALPPGHQALSPALPAILQLSAFPSRTARDRDRRLARARARRLPRGLCRRCKARTMHPRSDQSSAPLPIFATRTHKTPLRRSGHPVRPWELSAPPPILHCWGERCT